jgi:Putative zinc-finger
MTCEEIREELVAYQDGELAEQDQQRVSVHLNTCLVCTQEASSLARVGQLFLSMERVTPAPDFAAKFWQRLEQENHAQPARHPESQLVRWWRDLRESMTNWHLTPALVGVVSLLIFFAALTQKPDRTTPTAEPEIVSTKKPETLAKPVAAKDPTVPAAVLEQIDFFVNYKLISDLDRLTHFEEIAAIDLEAEDAIAVAEAEVPKEVLDDPGFFAQYQILQQLERLEHFDSILASPSQDDAEIQG